MKNKNKTVKEVLSYYDVGLILIVVLLCVFGLMMVYSTSYYNADYYYQDEVKYFSSQLRNFIIGFVLMIAVSMIDYHFYFKAVTIKGCKVRIVLIIGYLICCGSQVYAMAFGHSSNGSSRWINIAGFTLQPSEMMKVLFILMVPFLCVRFRKIFDGIGGFLLTLVIMGIPFFLVAKVNLSSGLILIGILGVVCFVATRKKWWYVPIVPVGLLIAYFGAKLVGYRANRIDEFFSNNVDTGSQIMQGLYAIASGGLFGKGLGNGVLKKGYIQEVHTDMIFTVICEELGIIGGICVIIVFMMLIIRILSIAFSASDALGRLIATGVLAQVALQVFLNIAVVTRMIPATGIPLPFISYGGSSLIFLMLEMGIVLNVSKKSGVEIED